MKEHLKTVFFCALEIKQLCKAFKLGVSKATGLDTPHRSDLLQRTSSFSPLTVRSTQAVCLRETKRMAQDFPNINQSVRALDSTTNNKQQAFTPTINLLSTKDKYCL